MGTSEGWCQVLKQLGHWFYNYKLNLKNVKVCELTLTEEDQNSSGPLQRTHGVAKQKNRAEDGEELPCGCDDGAGQGSKVDHSQKNEGLLTTCETRSVRCAGFQKGHVHLWFSHPPVLEHWSLQTAWCCRWHSGNVQWSSGTPRVHPSTGWLTAEEMKAWRNTKEKHITSFLQQPSSVCSVRHLVAKHNNDTIVATSGI